MKIVLVLPSIPAYSETFFNTKIKGLQASGFEVSLFVIHHKNANTTYKQKVISIYSGNKMQIFFKAVQSLFFNIFYFKKASKLFLLNKKDGKSILLSLKNNFENGLFLNTKTDWMHFGYGTITQGRENIGLALNCKSAVSFRGFDIGVYPLNNQNCYDLLWRKVDKIHVISDDIKNLVIKNGFANTNKIFKINPAIDTNFFQPTTNIAQGTTHNFLTIGRLHWKKGFEYTLEALALLKQKGVDFQYTIIGVGAEKERLQFAAHQLNLTNTIVFKGKLNPDEVKNELALANIYLQYSIQEGFCNSVLEAQAMGLLCLVSDAEGLSENVLDNKTGCVVEKRNSLLLANKIMEVINLSEIEKLKISKTAIARIQNEFSVEKQLQNFIAFYTN